MRTRITIEIQLCNEQWTQPSVREYTALSAGTKPFRSLMRSAVSDNSPVMTVEEMLSILMLTFILTFWHLTGVKHQLVGSRHWNKTLTIIVSSQPRVSLRFTLSLYSQWQFYYCEPHLILCTQWMNKHIWISGESLVIRMAGNTLNVFGYFFNRPSLTC